MARACPDHEPELIEFINRHIGASEPGLVTQPVSAEWETVGRFALG